ncbi:MAG: LAGLIDADG family homing endonuclease [Candidatus Woesearchaeota archaeon]|jgi:hypothetical protein|nr:LAGLIDADG family homing endonuclease [Candidatus Woesearchaeota archaeon]MDP7506117.1 LAGLIDADG family homing endonuclease [Candidatus Woesearchaeota archaeon]MDP7610208.1 LAGLIDADG family homing endonuclease [Candidatus Woesearchaeota archaeon]|tara:strand:- start:4114 stop:5049 length:936 start_codon:yes stop_codon:yes gene_type:complete
MKINQNLAAIHGYLCGDGYISGRDKEVCIRFSNTNLTLVKDFKKRFERLCDINHKITIKKVKNKKILYCYSGTQNKIYEKLMKYEPYYTENWEIPIEFLDKQGLSLWLRAFFDSEGWLQFRPHQTRTIGVHSLNHKGLLQIRSLLKAVFGIDSIVKKRNGRNISYLGIYGKDDLTKFHKEIGFLHSEKRKKLPKIVNSYVDYTWKFPEGPIKLKNFIEHMLKKKAKPKLCRGKPIYVRFNSIKEDNLKKLSKHLYDLFKIKSKIYRCVNGHGTVYYELNIQEVESVRKMLENNLLNKSMKETLTFTNSHRS